MNDEFRPQIEMSFEEIFQRLDAAYSTKKPNISCGCLVGLILLCLFLNTVGGKEILYFFLILVGLCVLSSLWSYYHNQQKRKLYSEILNRMFNGDTSFKSIAAKTGADVNTVAAAVQEMIHKDILPSHNCRIIDNGQGLEFFVSDEDAARQRREWLLSRNIRPDEYQSPQQPKPPAPPQYARVCKGCGAANPDNHSHCKYCGMAYDRVE